MFCKQCGTQVENTAAACPKCGTRLAEASNAAAAVTDKMKAASKDTLQAFLKFATDPVGGLSPAYQSLGAARALRVGISFGIVFTLCVLLGSYRLIPDYARSPGVGGFFRLLVSAFIPFPSLVGASALARLVSRGKGALSNDSFIAGAALLPFGFAILLSSLLGMGNYELVGALTLFAFCLTVLMLFAGCTRISAMSERTATIAVPLMLLLSGWITKVIFAATMNSQGMAPMLYPGAQ
jgi:zinc-ribbon domain